MVSTVSTKIYKAVIAFQLESNVNTAHTSCSFSTDDEKKFVQDIISELLSARSKDIDSNFSTFTRRKNYVFICSR